MDTVTNKIIEQFKKTRHFTKDALDLSSHVIVDILEKEQQLAFKRVEEKFAERVKSLELKPTTKKYKEEQAAYFVGAMIALNTTNVIWVLCINSGRIILDETKNG